MQKKSFLSLCILFAYGIGSANLHAMQQDSSIRSLPKELQEHILLSEKFGYLKSIITFLGLQPITLNGPVSHNTPIVSIELYGDIVQTKSKSTDVYSRWSTMLWNVHTGAHIFANQVEQYQLWEYAKQVAIHQNKALNITAQHCPSGITRFNKTELWDIDAQKRLDKREHGDEIISIALDSNNIVIGLLNNTLKIWPVDEKEKNKDRLIHIGEPISAVATDNNMVMFGLFDGIMGVLNLSEDVLKPSFFKAHDDKISVIKIYDATIVTGSRDANIKIWDRSTHALLRILNGPNGHMHSIKSIAMDGDRMITGSKDCIAKIWPLKVNYQGTPENNPLIWIIYNAEIAHLYFIRKAYKATKKNEELIINLPKRLGYIERDETIEQMDGRIYFCFPKEVRQYLKHRLNIRIPPELIMEKIYTACASFFTKKIEQINTIIGKI